MALASFFVPGEVSPSLKAASQGSTRRRVNNLPPVCPRHSSDAVSMLSAPQVVCLLSLQEQCSTLQALSQPSLLTSKTPGFKPCLLLKVMKFSPCHFPSQWLWGNILLVHSAVCSLAVLHDHGSPPLRSTCNPCLP